MRYIRYFVILFIVLLLTSAAQSQSLSVGATNGINISDIHTSGSTGKWKSKAGPQVGIFADYSLNRIFGLRTGFNYSAVYYEHKDYSDLNPVYQEFGYSSSMYPDPLLRMYIPVNEKMDFNFLTIPFQIRLSIPSKPQLDLRGGIYYSFLHEYSFNSYYMNMVEPAKHDFGYIWSAGLSYPVADNFTISLNTSYSTGRTEIIENGGYRHGYADFTLGLAYNGFLKKSRVVKNSSVNDSIPGLITITYFGGMNLNWNSCEYYREKYSFNTGISAGFKLNLRMSPKSSFQTGLSFERKGYTFNDTSSVYYRYVEDGDPVYDLDTEVGIDYLVVPALLNLNIGRSGRFYINTGPYMGFMLNARVTGEAYHATTYNEGYYQYTKTTVYDDIGSLIKGTDFGWIFGGGMTIPLKGMPGIDIGLRYSSGFTDVLDRSVNPEDPVDTYTSVMKNSSLSFHLGFAVPGIR
jgi:hypothetical protein